MFKFNKAIKSILISMLAVAGLSLSAHAQKILIIDEDRVQREALAFKNFSIQTEKHRQQIQGLRSLIARGGQFEAQLADLEKRKSIIGNDKYEEEQRKLGAQFQQAQRSLQFSEYGYDQKRQELMRQIELARQPILREMLKERSADVIMPKRIVYVATTGIDITTEFIERLDTALPQVNLPEDAPAAAPAEGEGTAPQQ